MTILEELSRCRYVSLTTYRKDGRGVATPVWAAVEGGELFVWSNPESWKVKRIRNNDRVVVTGCDYRGRIAEGAPSAEGTARLLDRDGTGAARQLLARKYLLMRVSNWYDRVLRRGRRPSIAIAVTVRV